MSRGGTRTAALALLERAPLVLFAAVVLGFSLASPAFLRADNAMNILVQASSTGILAVGMTFVLLTAGVDLSVGSIMFVAAAVGGKLALAGWPIAGVLGVMLAVGAAFGAVNALFITRFAVMAFVVTLATRYFGRGLGLRLTETRAMNLPDDFYALGAGRWLGVPVPVLILFAVVLLAHTLLTCTPFGRHVHAVGQDPAAARAAGIRTGWVLSAAYVVCALCATVAAVVALSQAPAVSPAFGNNREFLAIAAAVLGGTSLFGGRGAVFPGTLLGAVLIQTLENGLTLLNVNPYLYPLVTGAVILLAVLLDATRSRVLAQVNRRRIFIEPEAPPRPTATARRRAS